MKRHFFSSPKVGLFSIFFAIVLTVFSIWLPFGFSLMGLIEEWGVLGLFARYHLFFVVTPHGLMDINAIRPLTIFPHALAYYLDPNSFDAWHGLLIASLFVKGMSCAYLIWFLLRSRAWALLGGVLMIVYPADTMQLSFRGIHINWAVSCFLLASVLWLYAFESKQKWMSICVSIFSSVVFGVSLLLYEVAFLLFCFPFLMVCARDGFHQGILSLKNRKTEMLIWSLSGFVFLLHAIFIYSTMSTYQPGFEQSVLHGKGSEVFYDLFRLTFIGLFRGLFAGWVDAFLIFLREWSVSGYLYVFLFSLGIFSLWICLLQDKGKTNSGLAFRLMGLGVIALFLGFAEFLWIPGYLYETERIYLCGTIGGVLFWVGLLSLCQSKWRWTSKGMVFVFLMVGLSQQLFQFQQYIKISDRQRHVLREIVKQYNQNSFKKTLLILDESEQLSQKYLLFNLQGALNYLYPMKAPVNIQICYMPSHEWEKMESTLPGSCEERKAVWVFKDAQNRKTSLISKSDMQSIVIPKEKNEAVNAQLELPGIFLKNEDSALKEKYQRILMPFLWKNHFTGLWRQNKNHFYWQSSDYFNLDTPVRGAGWGGVSWRKQYGVLPVPFIWQTQKTSSLQFYFMPKKGIHYILEGRSRFKSHRYGGESIKIYLNNLPLNLDWSQDNWRTVILGEDLKMGWNRLVFNNLYFGENNQFSLRDLMIRPQE